MPGWDSLEGTQPSNGSELLLENAEKLGGYLANTLAENGTQVIISRNNIGTKLHIHYVVNETLILLVLRAESIVVQDDTVFSDLTFPGPSDTINFTTTNAASITIPGDLLQMRSKRS